MPRTTIDALMGDGQGTSVKQFQSAGRRISVEDYVATPEKVGVGQAFSSDSRYDKYVRTPEDLMNIDSIRALNQPWYAQALGAINQAVLGEVVGGTIMSIGAIGAIPEMFKKSQNDFHNTLYDVGNTIRQWTSKETPIYQTRYRDFTDKDFLSGWFFGNVPSLASAAASFIPGMGAAKGIRWLGGFAKLGELATGIAETAIGAGLMRHAENYREASNVYDNAYQSALLAGKSEAEARQIASTVGYQDYYANSINYISDVIQLGAILRPFRAMTRNVGLLSFDLASATGKLPTSAIGKGTYWLADKILPQASEGVEEVVNQISQIEAERSADKMVNPHKYVDDDSDLVSRIAGYLGRPDVKDSFVWGVAGGVIGGGIVDAISGEGGTDKARIQEKMATIASRQKTIQSYADQIKEIDASELSDEDKISQRKQVAKSMTADLGFRFARSGDIDVLLDHVDSKGFAKEMAEMGWGDEATIQEQLPELRRGILEAEEIYKKQFNRFAKSPINDYIKRAIVDNSARLDYARSQNIEGLSQLQKEETELRGNDEYKKSVIDKQAVANPEIVIDYDNTIRKYSLLSAYNELQSNIAFARAKGHEDNAVRLEKVADIINKRDKEISFGKSKIDHSAISQQLVSNKAEQEILTAHNEVLGEEMAYLQTKKGQDEIVENAKKMAETVVENKGKIDEVKATEEATTRVGTPVEQHEWEKLPDINEAEYKDFTDNGVVEDIRLLDIAHKVKNGEPLNKMEQAIMTAKTAEINDMLVSIRGAEVKDEIVNSEKETHEIIKPKEEPVVKDEKEPETTKFNKNTGKTEIITDRRQGEKASLSVGYQARGFQKVVGGKTIEGEWNEKFLPLLLPETMKPGTRVELRIPPNVDDVVVGKSQTWGDKKGKYSADEIYKHIPIGIYLDGVFTETFLHDVDWIKSDNVQDSFVESEKQNLDDIRKELYDQLKDGGAYETTVSDKTNGTVLTTEDVDITGKRIGDKREIFIGVADKDKNIGVVLNNGNITYNNDKIAMAELSPKFKQTIKNGHTFILVPVSTNKSGQTVYYPKWVPTMRINAMRSAYGYDIINSLAEAIKIYFDYSKKNTTFESEILQKVADMQEYVEYFVYNMNEGDKSFGALATKQDPHGDKSFLSLRKTRNSGLKLDIYNGGDLYHFYSDGKRGIKLTINGKLTEYSDELLKEALAGNVRAGLLFSTNRDNVNKKVPLLMGKEIKSVEYKDVILGMTETNLTHVKVGDRVAYTTQPVIKLDLQAKRETVKRVPVGEFTVEQEIRVESPINKLFPTSDDETQELINHCEK